ncbi:MAG: sigma-70 family RNA polymerase sigma factor, partial [Victivallales bacterium]
MKAKKSEKKIKKTSKPSAKKIVAKKVDKIKPSAKTVKTDKVKKQPAIKTAPSKVKNASVKKKPAKAVAVKKAAIKTVRPSAQDKKITASKKAIVKKIGNKTSASHKDEKPVAKAVKVVENVKIGTAKAAKTAVKSVKVPMQEPLESAPELPGKRKVGRPRKIGSEGGVAAPRPSKREASQDDTSSLSKNDTMKVYMQDIGQISLVTKEEEVELAAKIHGTDMKLKEEARATLIKANLRLVVKIAHDFKGLGLPLLDLISEGNIGLMRAVEKFDPAKGAKFSSYAAWWIKQSMRRALANQSKTIRIPVQSAGKINKIKSA